MTWDDLIYAFILLISLLCGFSSSEIDRNYRKYFMCFVGLAFVFSVCGQAIWHSLLITSVSIFLILTKVKGFHVIVFVFCFSYLAFFRTCHYFGFSKPPSYSNAVQLVLTLKLIGAAFEVNDSIHREKELQKLLLSDGSKEVIDKLKLEIKYFNVGRNFFNLFTYSYCFVGLLTGPYYKYRVFMDCVERDWLTSMDRFKRFWNRFKLASCFGICYLFLSHFYYIEYAKTDEFFNRSFIYRIMFMVVIFMVFRFRMYFAWLMCECICMCSYMGAYPASSQPVPGHGPKNLEALEMESKEKSCKEINFETTRNLSIPGCEWAPSIREGMRSWNMSVQYWLATFIYRRFPVKSYRTAVTMLVSAFWHGVHPGYYLSFLTIPIGLQAEQSLERILGWKESERIELDNWKPKHLVKNGKLLIRWFFKMRVFDYCCMGFLLLEGYATLQYWWSIRLSIHLVMFILVSISALKNIWL